MKKTIALTLLLLLIPSLITPCIALYSESAIAAAPKVGKTAKYGVWQFSLQTLGTAGRTMKNPLDPESTLEAAGHWVYAQVRITNTSATRQSAKNLILAAGSTLVNPKGKSYDLDTEATGYFYDRLEEKPFSPGESRDIYFFFDTPTNESFQRLEIVAMKSLANIRLSF